MEALMDALANAECAARPRAENGQTEPALPSNQKSEFRNQNSEIPPSVRPIFVMNTSAYDTVETLRRLEGRMDVYLPDLKYMDSALAARLSGAADYPPIAAAVLREMFRQKGGNIWLAEDGGIESGLIVRHLVLPGQVENSKACLRFIAEELSPSVHLSLLAQYRPTPAVASDPDLGRLLRAEEYQEVLDEMERLGFYRGWTQQLISAGNYNPDFQRPNPFE